MSNNQYHYRPWHLPEHTHPTAWAARSTARTIKRRDPTRPAFWYLGFRHPHCHQRSAPGVTIQPSPRRTRGGSDGRLDDSREPIASVRP